MRQMKKLKSRLLSCILVVAMLVGMIPTTVFAADTGTNYKSQYGITVLVDGSEMDLVADGTETCGVMQAQKLNVTVPAGTTEVTFKNITDEVLWGQMYIYSGAHDWTEYASNVTEATISLAECGTSFCVSDSANAWYHVNITVAEEEEEPANKYTIDVSGFDGNVTADKAEAAEGETVILTVTPDEGYEFGYFEVYETENYDEVNLEFTELENNQYSFVMPAYGLDITGFFKKGAASASDAGFVIKVNDVEMELVDGGTEACTARYVSDMFRVLNVTVPTGTKTVIVERKSETASPNIQYMKDGAHSFGGNAMPTFEANVVDYDGLCISCGGNYYHVNIIEQEKVGEYQSITTDMEGDVIVTEQEQIDGWIDYYHVVVPRGSSYAYVTYPADTIYVYDGMALVVEYAFDGSYSPQKQWKATENDDGSVTVALPISELLTEKPGVGYAVCFWKASGMEVLEGFTFSYAEDTTVWLVTLAAGNGYTTDGAGYVKNGEDYSFTIDIKNGYDAANMVVKVNGKEVKADENGVYTVEAVSEDLVITVEGVESIPTDGDVDVYFSVEKGNQFVEQGGVVWALEEVTIPYFDLALYDMEYLYYNPDCYAEGQASQKAGTKETADGVVTLLHMMIWVTEVYYNGLEPDDAGKGWLAENNWKGFSVYSATAGSAFFYIWDLGTDFNYYINYEYPLGYPGWGATCDQIKLSDGDVVSLRYNDNSGKVGTYHHFGEKALVTKTVDKGQDFDLEIYRTGEDYANYTTPVFKVGEGHKVYVFAEDEIDVNPSKGTLMSTTDADGKVTIDTSDLEAGTYYLVSDSTSPAVMLLTVEGENAEEPTPEYQLGDVDMDGDIDTEDAGLVVSSYYESVELSEAQMKLGDVDGDGDVDTEDAGLIVSYYYESIESFS